MTWVKLDDGFHDHPKVLAAGPLAGWLYVSALCYCAKHCTDGFVSNAAIARLARGAKAATLVDRLVAVGLFERATDGCVIHDYHDFQPSAAEVKERRASTSARVRDWRARQKPPGNAVTPAECNAVTSSIHDDVTPRARARDPVPSRPVPDPKRESALPRVPEVQPFSTTARHDAAEIFKDEACKIMPSGAWDFNGGGERRAVGNAVAAHASATATVEERHLWIRMKLREWVARDPRAIEFGLVPFKFADWLRAGCPTRDATTVDKGPKPIPPPPEMSKTQVAEREAWARDRIKPEDAKNIDIEAIFAPKTATR